MQSQRSVIDVVGRSARRVSRGAGSRTIFIDSPARVARRQGKPSALGTTPASKPPGGGAVWLGLILAVVALLPTVGQAQIVEWARSAGGAECDQARAIAVDPAGNSYVTGFYHETVTFGSFTLTSAGFDDIFVAKYDVDGNPDWARSVGGIGSDAGWGIAVDADGNSYVTGTAGGVFVSKYDISGNVLWAVSGGTIGVGIAIALDTAGNSYVTGTFSDTATFGSFTLTSAGGPDIFVAKYDGSGSVLWAVSAGGPGGAFSGEYGLGIGVDTGGNTYVTGKFELTATFGSFMLTSAGGNDIFVASYDADGNVLWARSAGGSEAASNDFGRAIAVDGPGNSYVTGQFQDTATFGPFTLTSAGGTDMFLAKYDSSGNVLWARSGGGTGSDDGWGITVDATGNSYVTGAISGTASFGSFTLIVSPFDTNTGLLVAVYDTSGNVLSATGTPNPLGRGIGVSAGGNIYVTGPFTQTAIFGTFPLTSAGAGDIFVVKYDSCGNGIVESGEECDGMDDTVCPGECLSNCRCPEPEPPDPFCGDGVCDPAEDSCNCPDDCGTPAQSEIPGSTCTDRLDNDCDGNADCDDPDCKDDDPACEGVPTVSQWGMAVLLVVLLTGIALKFRRSRAT